MYICCQISYQCPLSSGDIAVARNANVNVIYAYVATTSTDIICITTIIDIKDIKIFINITDVSSNKTKPSRWNRVFRCSPKMIFSVSYCISIVQVL